MIKSAFKKLYLFIFVNSFPLPKFAPFTPNVGLSVGQLRFFRALGAFYMLLLAPMSLFLVIIAIPGQSSIESEFQNFLSLMFVLPIIFALSSIGMMFAPERFYINWAIPLIYTLLIFTLYF